MDPSDVVTALISAVGGILAVLVGQRLSRTAQREMTPAQVISDLRARVDVLEDDREKDRAYNRRLWEWARHHLDLYYRHRRDGAPDPEPIPEED